MARPCFHCVWWRPISASVPLGSAVVDVVSEASGGNRGQGGGHPAIAVVVVDSPVATALGAFGPTLLPQAPNTMAAATTAASNLSVFMHLTPYVSIYRVTGTSECSPASQEPS